MTSEHVGIDRGTIAEDHGRLKSRLTHVHEQLLMASVTPAQAERELAGIRAELEEHFADEEVGGFFSGILAEAPEMDERVLGLMWDHKEFRIRLRLLHTTYRWACGESGARAGWLAEFAEFHRRFDEHEQAEHDLLHEAFQRDVGAGD